MSTPSQHDALSPKDLQYYAPRKLRDGSVSPSIQPSPRTDESHPAADEWTAAITPLPTAFRTALDDLNKHDTDLRLAPAKRKAAFGAVTAAIAIGIAVGIGLVEFVSRDAKPVPLATRLQVATSDLQKVTTQGALPALTLTTRTAEASPQLASAVTEVAAVVSPAQAQDAQSPAPPPVSPSAPTLAAAPVATPVVTPTPAPAPPAPAPAVTASSNIVTPPAPRQIDAKAVAALLRRADELLTNGDIAAARLLLQRVAETHNARAAFTLATTYDPTVTKRSGGASVAADPALAQLWYQRARDWGSPDAAGHIEALASQNRDNR